MIKAADGLYSANLGTIVLWYGTAFGIANQTPYSFYFTVMWQLLIRGRIQKNGRIAKYSRGRHLNPTAIRCPGYSHIHFEMLWFIPFFAAVFILRFLTTIVLHSFIHSLHQRANEKLSNRVALQQNQEQYLG